MSTYTDLHNKIKENITVGYSPDDRMTTQHVRFCNPENEYWGTFHGKFNAEQVDVSGGTLKNLVIVDSTLSNVSWPGGVNFDEFGRNMSVLSNQVLDIIESRLPDVRNELTSEQQTRLNADKDLETLVKTTDVRLSAFTDSIKTELKNDLSTAVHALTDQDFMLSTMLGHQDRSISTALDTKINELSANTAAVDAELDAKIDSEIAARESADAFLSAQHDTLRHDFAEEVDDRTFEEAKLRQQIVDETAARRSADTELSESVAALEASAALSIDSLNDLAVTKIEHDRHYVIKTNVGSMAAAKDYPYQLDDYTVNIFDLGNIAGRVYWNNDEGNRVEVGQVVQPNPDSPILPLPITFTPFTEIESDQLLSAMDSYRSFTFDENVNEYRSGDCTSYKIRFNQSQYSVNSQLSDCGFILSPISEQYHQVIINENGEIPAGYVTEAYPTGNQSNILSGRLTLDTAGLPEFEVFKDYSGLAFDTAELSSKELPNKTKVTYLGSNRFLLEKNRVEKNYIPLTDVIGSIGEFGRVYEFDNAGNSSVTWDDEGQLKSVIVHLNAPYNTKPYKLQKDSSGKYSVLVAENEYGKSNVYLTAEATQLSATFSLVAYSKQYKYQLYGLDEDGSIEPLDGCYIVPSTYNKDFVEAGEDCDTIDAYIGNIVWLNAFKSMSPFTLTKAGEKLWTCEYRDEATQSVLNAKYDGTTRKLRFKVTALDGGQVVA